MGVYLVRCSCDLLDRPGQAKWLLVLVSFPRRHATLAGHSRWLISSNSSSCWKQATLAGMVGADGRVGGTNYPSCFWQVRYHWRTFCTALVSWLTGNSCWDSWAASYVLFWLSSRKSSHCNCMRDQPEQRDMSQAQLFYSGQYSWSNWKSQHIRTVLGHIMLKTPILVWIWVVLVLGWVTQARTEGLTLVLMLQVLWWVTFLDCSNAFNPKRLPRFDIFFHLPFSGKVSRSRQYYNACQIVTELEQAP
jgi:hypothetical protein